MTITERAALIHKLRAELAALELEQSREVIPFSDWLRKHVGKNWVIARRTTRIVHRYGDDVICLSPARYAKLEAEYEAETGLSPNYYPH